MHITLGTIIYHLRQHLFGERGFNKTKLGTGLLPNSKDERDFKLGIFGFGEYKPQHQEWEIKIPWIKNQRSFNTCVLNSATAQKEQDENVELSVRSLVLFAKRDGLIQGNGFSSLRDIQKCIQKYGIAEAKLLPENVDTWEEYSDVNLLTPEIIENAALHKSKSYWYTQSRSDTLKLLDEGKILHTGMAWYQGFNMGGGFSWPWLIMMIRGFLVGGHAFDIVGYKLDYRGIAVYKMLNSYGQFWGENGYFYVSMDFFDDVGYERYVQIDIEPEIAKIIALNQGGFVKDKDSSAIYFITKNTKMPFPDMETFLAYDGVRKQYIEVNHNALEAIPTGETMDITKTKYWPYIKDIDRSEWAKTIALLSAKK